MPALLHCCVVAGAHNNVADGVTVFSAVQFFAGFFAFCVCSVVVVNGSTVAVFRSIGAAAAAESQVPAGTLHANNSHMAAAAVRGHMLMLL